MKQVLVIRHANWGEDGRLTEAGISACKEMASYLGEFDIVAASSTSRSKQTALLLAGVEPKEDKRAGVPVGLTEAQKQKITERRKTHPLGIVGVFWEMPEFVPEVRRAGERLLDLVNETLVALGDNGRALIVTHDGTMVALEKLIKHESFDAADHTFNELEGFIVGEDMSLQTLKRK